MIDAIDRFLLELPRQTVDNIAMLITALAVIFVGALVVRIALLLGSRSAEPPGHREQVRDISDSSEAELDER